MITCNNCGAVYDRPDGLLLYINEHYRCARCCASGFREYDEAWNSDGTWLLGFLGLALGLILGGVSGGITLMLVGIVAGGQRRRLNNKRELPVTAEELPEDSADASSGCAD